MTKKQKWLFYGIGLVAGTGVMIERLVTTKVYATFRPNIDLHNDLIFLLALFSVFFGVSFIGLLVALLLKKLRYRHPFSVGLTGTFFTMPLFYLNTATSLTGTFLFIVMTIVATPGVFALAYLYFDRLQARYWVKSTVVAIAFIAWFAGILAFSVYLHQFVATGFSG